MGHFEHSVATNSAMTGAALSKRATTPMTVWGTTANNELLRVSMGCNGDSQGRLDGDWMTLLGHPFRNGWCAVHTGTMRCLGECRVP